MRGGVKSSSSKRHKFVAEGYLSHASKETKDSLSLSENVNA